MNPFYTDYCPLCKSKLIHLTSPGYLLYECPIHKPASKGYASRTHYFSSWNRNECRFELAEFEVDGFFLKYDKTGTTIYKLRSPPSTSYDYAFTMEGHFPVDFNDPNKAADRLKALLVFS